MTYAIDEMAPIMWVFFVILAFVIFIGILRFGYIWVMEDPCRAYRVLAYWFGPVGEHCGMVVE